MLQQGQHAPAEFGQVGVLALAPKEFTPQLLLERLDRSCQRRLSDVALSAALVKFKVLDRARK